MTPNLKEHKTQAAEARNLKRIEKTIDLITQINDDSTLLNPGILKCLDSAHWILREVREHLA